MRSSVKKVKDCRVRLSVEVEPERFENRYKEVLRDFQKEAQDPKAPECRGFGVSVKSVLRDSSGKPWCLAELHVGPCYSEPMILELREGAWREVAIRDQRLSQQGWECWGTLEGSAVKAWGVLDCQVESPGWDLVVMVLDEKGWRIQGSLKKCSHYAGLWSMHMHPDGTGEAVLTLGEDYTQDVPKGFYHYRISGFGKAWELVKRTDHEDPVAPPESGKTGRFPGYWDIEREVLMDSWPEK